MSTVKATNFQHASAANPAIVLAADGSATANVSSINNGPLAGMRNRIVNGDMRIDQRNAGASFTSSGLFYCLDRWLLQAVGATNTAQQVTGSTGNNKAVRITGNTGNTLTGFSQKIESWNILDLAAQTVTLSFTLSGSSAGAVSVRRLYPTAADNYTATTEPAAGTSINFTTTPTRYTLSFTLDANANKGFWLFFDFGGVGSGVTRTLEDVQLEPGTVATPFERRPIGTELALCQRYFQQLGGGMVGFEEGNVTHSYGLRFIQPMRAAPTFSLISSSFAYRYINPGVGDRTILISINGATSISTQAAWLYFNDLSTGSVTGRGAIERLGSNYINASAEL